MVSEATTKMAVQQSASEVMTKTEGAMSEATTTKAKKP